MAPLITIRVQSCYSKLVYHTSFGYCLCLDKVYILFSSSSVLLNDYFQYVNRIPMTRIFSKYGTLSIYGRNLDFLCSLLCWDTDIQRLIGLKTRKFLESMTQYLIHSLLLIHILWLHGIGKDHGYICRLSVEDLIQQATAAYYGCLKVLPTRTFKEAMHLCWNLLCSIGI